MPNLIKNIRGNTIIGVLVSLGILSILSYTIFTLTVTTLQLIGFTRSRVTARNIASGELEQLRNMSYENLGTQGGIPSGNLEQEETIVRNGQAYKLKRTITYIDDPFDGFAPTDTLPTDYKKVRIEVSWEGISRSGVDPVVLTTNIAPKGIEASAGGGTLSILVFDANANPVQQAQVAIISNDPTNPINTTQQTSDTGRIVLPGTPACLSCYEITVTKEGFSTDRTYSSSEVATPDKPHVSVIENELTEVSFAIDRTSSITLRSFGPKSAGYPQVGNVNILVRGDKTIGVNVADEPVYKYENTATTNSSGTVILENMEWDNYRLFVLETQTDSIAGTKPILPITLLPNTSTQIDFTVNSFSNHNLLTAFLAPDMSPVASVSATLFDGITPIATSSSGLENSPDYGQVFFGSLTQKIYRLEATASGFQNTSIDINVSGQTNERIFLNP